MIATPRKTDPTPAVQTAAIQAAAIEYVKRGFAITWMGYGDKFPRHEGWNTTPKVVTTPEQARKVWNGTPFNIGVVHGLGTVKTCSLDADRVQDARAVLAEFGIDLDELCIGVPMVEGKPGNFRLLYRQPSGLDLPLIKLEWPDPDNPKSKVTVFELRAGANQDVLPPSRHPSGKLYEWLTPLPADPPDMPEPPPALLELWRNWESWRPELQTACPWASSPEPKASTRPKEARPHVDVIGQFNAAHDVARLLEANGYKRKGRRRFLPPNSTSGVPSVRILDSGKVFSTNGSCLLNDGHAHDAFSTFCILEHGGGVQSAVKAAAALLGIELKPDHAPVRHEAPAHAPVAAVPDSESGAFTRHDTRLRRKSGSSEVLKSLPNAITICENLIPGLIGYNAFRQRIEARIPAPWRKSPGAWGDYDTAELAALISSRYFPDFSPEKLLTAVMVTARRNEFNPAQDRLRALAAQWDGVSRLATWLEDYLSAELTPTNREYLAEIGAAWLKGVAARVLFPGCKRDDVLVMRSPQGYLKSTAAQAIADSIMPDAFTDCIGNIESKDAKADIRGVIIAELGELAALSKSSIEGIKAFVATRSDHFRESYGKLASDYPRTVSFIGTTNDERFLKDPTGNRRWWPVTITAPIDIPRLESALPQLLGEAASRVLAGEVWYVANRTALQQAETIRSDCFDHDVWTEAALRAAEHMADNDGYATVAGILEKMQVQTHMQTTSAQIRVGGILRVAGWTSKRRRVCRRLIVAWSPQGVHPSHRVNTDGDTRTHRQTAGVHPVSPCSPYFRNAEKNEGGEPTNAATNCSPTERDIDRSTDIGCTPCNRVNIQSNSGDSSITLPVHPSVHPQASRVNTLKTDTTTPGPDTAPDTPAKALSPLDQDIIAYLSRVAATATEEEVHRQTHRGQQGRTPAMTRIALAKLVTSGLVDKINGEFRLAGARP